MEQKDCAENLTCVKRICIRMEELAGNCDQDKCTPAFSYTPPDEILTDTTGRYLKRIEFETAIDSEGGPEMNAILSIWKWDESGEKIQQVCSTDNLNKDHDKFQKGFTDTFGPEAFDLCGAVNFNGLDIAQFQ